ncbi:hypothetical protein CPA57_03420 [Bombella sp. TMW2.1880]|uniref:Hedgehog/Intein (Hint) domain-containing protein n=1 Tax=Bombella favorum TaxID=2039164 RepID=A0ABR5ZLX2_9PROT|nr:hypothetical protein [Bombella favorum]
MVVGGGAGVSLQRAEGTFTLSARVRSEDPPAVIRTIYHLAPHSRLEWLPHGTIFFNGARLERFMAVEMADTASFLFYESRILGRCSSGEQLQRLHVRDRLSIQRDGHYHRAGNGDHRCGRAHRHAGRGQQSHSLYLPSAG